MGRQAAFPSFPRIASSAHNQGFQNIILPIANASPAEGSVEKESRNLMDQIQRSSLEGGNYPTSKLF